MSFSLFRTRYGGGDGATENNKKIHRMAKRVKTEAETSLTATVVAITLWLRARESEKERAEST